MPIATPQGTLDFKSVDKVTFVGASSNTVIDTTTGSLGVGVGVGGPTSNLHVVGNTRLEGDINMLHTANTASIKLNSNVVTEFPRSKKLIKYPRVVMTGETTSNYTVTGSSWYGSGANYEPWKAFDNVGNHSSGQLAWYSFDYTAPEAYSGTDNAFNPSHGGTATPVLFTGAVQGEWLKIQLPHKVALDHYIMYGPNMENEFPQDWTVYGSVNGTNWDQIDNRVSQIFGNGTGGSGTATGKTKEYQLDTQTDEYLYFAFVFTKASPNRTAYIGVGEIELFGVPEYDPEAHGTDVVVKSEANVPNTDWLEVYYDAKGLTPGAVTNPISGLGGTTINGTATNVTVSDGAFVFDGSSSYITGGTTSISGNHHHSFSCWLKPTSANSGYRCIGYLFYSGSNNTTTGLFLNNNQPVFLTWGNNLISDHTLVQNEWVHVTAVYNGTGRTIYVNSEQIDSDTYSSYNINASATLLVGASTTTPGEVFGGSIANFRIFNRALSQDEIYQLYAYQKEYFGHGDLSMTLKAGRLGIGTSEPRAVLDVKGDTFSRVYKGGRTTFLTWDYEGQRYVDISPPANNNSYANVANILDHTFDIPSCYHDLGRATLKAFVQIDWRGEVNRPWNFVFRIEVHYNGNQIAYSSSSDHAASYNNRGCGIPTVGYHNDHDSTPEAASVTSLFKLTDCDVSPGSTLKVQLVGQWGDISQLTQRVWTGRTAGNQNRPDFELPTSSFFVVLDVDDGY